jgi:hypothetical protein
MCKFTKVKLTLTTAEQTAHLHCSYTQPSQLSTRRHVVRKLRCVHVLRLLQRGVHTQGMPAVGPGLAASWPAGSPWAPAARPACRSGAWGSAPGWRCRPAAHLQQEAAAAQPYTAPVTTVMACPEEMQRLAADYGADLAPTSSLAKSRAESSNCWHWATHEACPPVQHTGMHTPVQHR